MTSVASSRSSDVIHKAASVGFGTAESTATYERARPSYPPDAIDRFLVRALSRTYPPGRPHSPDSGPIQQINVLDVGAGTGIFTRLLHSRLLHYEEHVDPTVKFSLVAVEPVEGMRVKYLEVTSPAIPIIAGSGSDLSAIPSSSISLVTCAQAFHWMATPSTLNEFSRVLIPNGALLLIWNTRDRRYPWVDQLEALIDQHYTPDVPRQQTGEFKRVFKREGVEGRWSELEEDRVDDGVVQKGDMQLMIDRVMSISVISALGEDDKRECENKVRAIIANHPDNEGKTQYALPYVTEIVLVFSA
jgi:SAM-dependent methyltransferase